MHAMPSCAADHRGQWLLTHLARCRAAREHRASAVRSLIEFAIILPLLVTITFGIIEFSGAYHDSAIAADAARAGGRVGSALATEPGVRDEHRPGAVERRAVDAADRRAEGALDLQGEREGLPGLGHRLLVVRGELHQVHLESERAGRSTPRDPQGGGWPASTQQVCTQPFDELGVYVKINHNFVTGLFGANVTLHGPLGVPASSRCRRRVCAS